MIYPTSGISIFAHLFVLTVGKTKSFLGIKTNKEKNIKDKNSVLNKTLVSFMVAAIIESVFFLVIGSSIVVADVGFLSDKSNIKIIEKIVYNFENSSNKTEVGYTKNYSPIIK